MRVWEQRKVIDLFKLETGTTPSTKDKGYWDGGSNLWITPTDLSKTNNNVFISDSERKVTDIALEKCNLTELPVDSLILSTRAPVGYVAIIKSPASFNQGCKGLVPKSKYKIDPTFYYYIFKSIKGYLQSISGGSTFKELSKNLLGSVGLPYPDFKEQKAIAEILYTVDDAIQKADEAIERTERLKQGMMQKLFTSGIGHDAFIETSIGKIPKDWVVASLGEYVLDTIGGGTPSTKNSDYWDGSIHWMTSANIKGMYAFTGQRRISVSGLNESSTNLIPKENLLVATRVGVGKACINKVDMAISQDLTGIILNKDLIKLEFIYWFLMNNESKIKSLAQGSTIKGILKTDLLKLKIPLPKIEEQVQIAKILTELLNLINKQFQRKEILTRIKRGLMNDLLSGNKRIKIN